MPQQPAIFFGHGSPMNAIEDNQFTQKWREIASGLPEAKMILIISAHYETNGVKVACSKNQKTIHDFYGFPDELFAVQYPARGDSAWAQRVLEVLGEGEIDENWGLDHGAWSILLHTHPKPQIPVLQLSLDRAKSAREHFELAKKLSVLCNEGVLILGSGNIVHNLRLLNWGGGSYDWAEQFNQEIVAAILAKDDEKVINFTKIAQSKLAVPTSEHFLPLLYILALRRESDRLELFNNAIDLGSISMVGVMFL
ncbi:MAG: 4,5-DOPA dioxygenase extradiol [Proteobacteria bacterium]|nr:4,5-DOPA dioxygenase extradiol [Pseudomonadota bacterium]